MRECGVSEEILMYMWDMWRKKILVVDPTRIGQKKRM